jgi:hypothetical protein
VNTVTARLKAEAVHPLLFAATAATGLLRCARNDDLGGLLPVFASLAVAMTDVPSLRGRYFVTARLKAEAVHPLLFAASAETGLLPVFASLAVAMTEAGSQ